MGAIALNTGTTPSCTSIDRPSPWSRGVLTEYKLKAQFGHIMTMADAKRPR